MGDSMQNQKICVTSDSSCTGCFLGCLAVEMSVLKVKVSRAGTRDEERWKQQARRLRSAIQNQGQGKGD